MDFGTDNDVMNLLKTEMQNEEIHVKVNAIHRLKIVVAALEERVNDLLIPYLQELSVYEDDEVLYAIAEEIGMIFPMVSDKLTFL